MPIINMFIWFAAWLTKAHPNVSKFDYKELRYTRCYEEPTN